jgi:hypothetical protein
MHGKGISLRPGGHGAGRGDGSGGRHAGPRTSVDGRAGSSIPTRFGACSRLGCAIKVSDGVAVRPTTGHRRRRKRRRRGIRRDSPTLASDSSRMADGSICRARIHRDHSRLRVRIPVSVKGPSKRALTRRQEWRAGTPCFAHRTTRKITQGHPRMGLSSHRGPDLPTCTGASARRPR